MEYPHLSEKTLRELQECLDEVSRAFALAFKPFSDIISSLPPWVLEKTPEKSKRKELYERRYNRRKKRSR